MKKSSFQSGSGARGQHIDSVVPFRVAISQRFSSIASRLVVVVLCTGILAFWLLGSLTSLRFNAALDAQATALSQFSERQLAVRLDGEAQLARARFEGLGKEVASRARQIAQRADIAQAIETQNEVTIRELLHGITAVSGFDRVLAFNKNGEILATDAYLSLVQIHGLIRSSVIHDPLLTVLTVNRSKNDLSGYENIKDIRDTFSKALQLPQHSIAHIAIEPVFEEFGDVIGALVAIRIVGRSENTLENFTTLANAGVLVLKDREIISAAGPQGVNFSSEKVGRAGLLLSDDEQHVARCVPYAVKLRVCTFTDVNVAMASRDQIFQIGVEQTKSMQRQFLLSAALTLTALILALLFTVRHTTRGLSDLASAAREVAHGNLNVRISATGVGEVYSLSAAFIRMLANLRRNVRRIEQLAYVDALTALPNREKMRIDAPDLISATNIGTVIFIDIDGFKSVNDTFGHSSGDTLLKHVAARLAQHMETPAGKVSVERQIIGRLGGDEFVVIFAVNAEHYDAGVLAQNIISSINQPFNIGGSQVSVGASIGIAVFPEDGSDYDTLLANADLAMYAAKREGRNGFAFFTRELAEQAKQRLRLENDLKAAVRSEALTVHYQPKVECRSGQIKGVEALVRWKHPELGNISPATFLKIAEEIRLINEIDLYVINRAVNEIGLLIRAGADLKLSVNVTAAEIEDAQFIESVAAVIVKHDFPPSHLELELTEFMALQNPGTFSQRVRKLRQMGVRFAVDDFGAGYSNLATLARLPIDTLKLDRSLISDVTRDQEKQSIARVAFSLASELGLDSVAEGVETIDEYYFVAGEGATNAQGFFCSPAVSISDLVALISSYSLGAFVPSEKRSISAA